jgi:putative acyl-CoA dehydrogenase
MNQPPAMPEHDAYVWNTALEEAVVRLGASSAEDRLHALGAIVGSWEAHDHAVRSDRHPPKLHRYDAAGERIDRVERDPSWHWLVDRTFEHDLHALPYRSGVPAAHATRAALVMLWAELDLPSVCPSSGNFAMVQALSADSELSRAWAGRLTTLDRSQLMFAAASMTERQGGSDVRNTCTVAVPQADGSYLLSGRKWFVTCPWADLVLVLANAPDGLTCFLTESRHAGFRIERLKEKLGWRALGVGEVELRELPAHRLGEEGRGVAAIMRMIAFTRLDVLLENVAAMRRGVVHAVHYARHRSIRGRPLLEQPLMASVLADLALETEAATVGAMTVAGSYDTGHAEFGRLALSLLKYWVTKRAASHAAEALECTGGNGYVEGSGMPRLLRDSVLGSIWEGSGNVLALDVLRTVRRDPGAFEAFAERCRSASGANRTLDRFRAETLDSVPAWAASENAEASARGMVERLALLLQASLLACHAPARIADTFCMARLEHPGLAWGASCAFVDVGFLVERVMPA